MAKSDGVPAYVIFPRCNARRNRTQRAGFHRGSEPDSWQSEREKLERFGSELLEVVGATSF